MATVTVQANEEASVRGLIGDWRKRSAPAISTASWPTTRRTSWRSTRSPRLQFKGRDAYRKHWQACLSMCPDPMIFEVHDLHLAAREDVAFGYCLSRCGGTGTDGVAKLEWMRATGCCRKTNGRWVIVHEHFSAPFDLESGKALFDVEP